MFNKLKKYQNTKGEVASLLTIISLVVISLGLITGYRLSAQRDVAINTDPLAAPRGTSPDNIPGDGVDRHDQVCFPGGDENQQVRDKYCRTRMFPENITRSMIDNADFRPKQVFNQLFSGVEQTINNPIITQTTINDDRTYSFYGGLCLNRSSVGNLNNFSTEDVEVYLSVFGVRKYADENGENIGIENRDINDTLAYLISSAEDQPRGTRSDTLFLAQSDQEVCTYPDGQTAPNLYGGEENPLLFRITATKQAILAKLQNAKNDPNLNQEFDEEACSLYVHLRDNTAAGSGATKPKDTYNIYKIDVRDLFNQDELAGICDNITPTPDTPVTLTPPETTPTEPISTPTEPVSTPTDIPDTGACFESCNPTTQCGLNPLTGKPLTCYRVQGLIEPPPPIVTNTPINGNEPDSDSINRRGTAVGLCQEGDPSCLCLPSKCTTEECSSYFQACGPDGPTPKDPPPTITPDEPGTPTPTTFNGSPTPQKTPNPETQACTFDALAYLQVCDPNNIDDTGRCIRNRDTGLFVGNPLTGEKLGGWGASNNKQLAGGRYEDGEPATLFSLVTGVSTGQIESLREVFPALRLFDFPLTNILFRDHITDLPEDADLVKIGSKEDLTPEGRTQNPILIYSKASELGEQYEPEQYYNFEDASVQLIGDLGKNGRYRVVPEGNEIITCDNSLLETNLNSGACNVSEYNALRFNEDYDKDEPEYANRDPRDTIGGLTVGCGQNILYGWTLQECISQGLDVVLAVDTSFTMRDHETGSGEVISTAVTAAVTEFITDMKTDFNNIERIGIVQFNREAETRLPLTETTDANLDNIIARLQDPSDPLLFNQEFSSIDLGLDEAGQVFNGSDSDNMKVVILVSDGGVNPAHDGNPPADHFSRGLQRVKDSAENLKDQGIRIVTIGYGLNTSPVYNNDLLRELSSTNDPETDSGDILYFPNPDDSTFSNVYAELESVLNSCDLADFRYFSFLEGQDINGDGVINTIDLFLIYDNYFARGEDLAEDLNNDGVVNSLDVSILVNYIGTTVPETTNSAQRTIGNIFN